MQLHCCRNTAAALPACRPLLWGDRQRQHRRRGHHLTAADSSAEGSSDLPDFQESFQRAAATQQALEEYRMQMQQPDDKQDLLLCTSLITKHRYPFLEHELVVQQLDDLAVQIEGRLPDSPYPLKVLQTISKHLYEDQGFRGNSTDYYTPDNSCLNMVLETRQGIPISLALIYMEVAKRVGIPMIGCNIPGHFFTSPADPELEFLVDPFGGSICFLEDAEQVLSNIYRQPIKLDPAFLTAKQPVPPRVFLARWINNLKQIYALLQQNYSNTFAISQYMIATRPGDIEELRDSGVFLYRLKRYPESVETLTEFLARAPADAEDTEMVRALLRSLQQHG